MKNRFYFLVILVLTLCNLNAQNAEDGQWYQLNGLEIFVPEGFTVNSRMGEGGLQTAIRKDGSGINSMLLVSVLDIEEEAEDDELVYLTDNIRQSLDEMGFKMSPFSTFPFKNRTGYQSRGKGSYVGITTQLTFKIVLLSHYLIYFWEYYGEDLSAEYKSIETSIRISMNQKKGGVQSISNGVFGFYYNADKIWASSKHDDNGEVTTFLFSLLESDGGTSFVEFNFTEKNVTNLYNFAMNWYGHMQDLFGNYFSSMNLNPMNPITFLGHDGYVRSGFATLVTTGETVLFSLKTGVIDGKFVWSASQKSLKTSLDMATRLFDQIEKSFTIGEMTSEVPVLCEPVTGGKMSVCVPVGWEIETDIDEDSNIITVSNEEQESVYVFEEMASYFSIDFLMGTIKKDPLFTEYATVWGKVDTATFQNREARQASFVISVEDKSLYGVACVFKGENGLNYVIYYLGNNKNVSFQDDEVIKSFRVQQ